jgi:hypothetical protein
MTNFNYEKGYCVLANPAFNNFNNNQAGAFNALLPMVKNLNQDKTLNIPLSQEMEDVLKPLSCQEIAVISRASYFVGHWFPGSLSEPFENGSGESWKVANVCDQVLRKRLDVPTRLQIHEGVLRVAFSSKNCWLWQEFGLATEKNLELFKSCKLSFCERKLNESAKKLAEMCDDLWEEDKIESLPSNAIYEQYLILKKEKQLIFLN